MANGTDAQADVFDRERSLWMKWRLPGLVAFGILVVVAVLFVARGALLPIVISVIVAELLFPIVANLERVLPGRARYPGATRLVTIGIVYIVFFTLMVLLIYLTVQPIIREMQEFIQVAPQIYEQAKVTIEGWIQEFDRQVPATVQAQLDELLRSAGGLVGKAALGVLTKTISSVTGTISVVIGLVIVPFLLFYMLKDKEELIGGMYAILPERAARHTGNVLALIDGVIGSYVRAQLISASIIGVFVFIGLSLLGINFALTLGLLAAVLGLIPIIGTFIGAAPGLLVALATAPDRLIWVALLYIIVQFIESNIISPRIQGRALRLHPIFIMITLIIASEIAGLWGVLVGVPLLAAARDVFAYFYSEWSGKGGREDEPADVDNVDNDEQAHVIAEDTAS